jgi:cysteine desulfurase / selenocysteine lyase
VTGWKQIREQFPALSSWTYLNTATYGQMPRRATDAVIQHFADRDQRACSDFLSWFDDADRLRATIARLIQATADDIAFIPNAAHALSILLTGLDWRTGDQIITFDDEFPNNLYAPCFTKGVDLVPTTWDRFESAITPRTRLVIVSMLNYSTGFRPPLEELSTLLRSRGILLYVDGTQGVGALRFDTAKIRPAMLAVHGYKWLLSPTGAGFLYVDPELRARLDPTVVGWRSDKNWRCFDHLQHGKPEFAESAEKYEAGMIPHALLYGMEQSVNMMLEIGPERIEGRVLALAEGVRDIVTELGGTIEHGNSPIVAARFENQDSSALSRALQANNVVVAARHGKLRVSTHFYNDESDLGKLRDVLKSQMARPVHS